MYLVLRIFCMSTYFSGPKYWLRKRFLAVNHLIASLNYWNCHIISHKRYDLFQNDQYSNTCLCLATLHNTWELQCENTLLSLCVSHPLIALSSPESLKVMEQGSMVNSGCGKTVLSRGNGFRAHVMAMWVERIHTHIYSLFNKHKIC